jgi:hypothetical protein
LDYRWESDYFASSLEVLDGYPFPKLSPTISVFDIDVVNTWLQSYDVVDGYFYQSIEPAIFNLSQSYSNWISKTDVVDEYYYPRIEPYKFRLDRVYSDWRRDEEELFFYPEPTSSPLIPRMGAFAYTQNIDELYIPISVRSLGMYALSKSNIQQITISPICEIKSSVTIPETCDIIYHNTTINSVTYPVNPIVFTAGDNYESILNGTIANITITDNTDFETLNYNKISYTGIDTLELGNNQNANINILAYNGDIVVSDTLTFSVVLPDKPIVSLIPNMTSYIFPYGKVIYSASLGTKLAWYVFDGTDTQSDTDTWTDWYSVLNNNPNKCYVGYEFGKHVYVDNISVSFYGDTAYTACFQCRYKGEWITAISNIQIPNTGYTKLDINLTNKMICDAIRICILSGDKPYFYMWNGGSNICELVVNGFEIE